MSYGILANMIQSSVNNDKRVALRGGGSAKKPQGERKPECRTIVIGTHKGRHNRSLDRRLKGLREGDRVVLEYGGDYCKYNWAAIASNPDGYHESELSFGQFRETYTHAIAKIKSLGAQPVLLTLPTLLPQRFFDHISRNLNRLLDDVKGKREQNVIEMITLRAMMKAKYSTFNCGHYGLAFDYYTHFTSPIRRYPDLMVHRLLTRYAEGGRNVGQDKYEEYCEHCSDMEQTAASAERASIKYKQVEYMNDHLGETFQGTISGVTEFGLYVEIDENKCEGMIPLRDLEGDYYDFDEQNYCLKGRRYHHQYNLGDSVKVQVARADLYRKQLDFKLVYPN